MIPSSVYSLFICAMAAHVLGTIAAPSKLESPCPNLFHYDSLNDPGKWTGTLVLQSDDELHGVWIRVIFDSEPTEVTAEGYEVVASKENSKQVLIKNRDVLLKTGSSTNVRITVKYDGDRFPNLIGFRLNAKAVCPEYNSIRKDFFRGDSNAKDFLSIVQSHIKHVAPKPGLKCGVRNSNIVPWQAAVFLNENGNDNYICDATLISPSHVILPGHCVTFNNDIDKVPSDRLSVSLVGNADRLDVSRIIVHRGYDPDTLVDDVAILELKSVLEINDNVRPICLEKSEIHDGKLALVGRAIGSNEIAEAAVEQVGPSECVARNPQLSGLTVERTLCVSYLPGKSPCVGNSGSSIRTFENNVATLRGFVTLGPILQNRNDCQEYTTVLGVNLNDYYSWILRSIS